MFPLSSNSQFAFSLAVTMSLSNGGGANTGEVLRAASQIAPNDFESYSASFRFLADAIHAAGNSTSTPSAKRDAFFRSASYYRAADFYLRSNLSDPRIYDLWDRQLADFDAAIALLPSPGKRFNVTSSAGGFDVPIIVYTPESASPGCQTTRRPTLLVGSGYDGAQEDLYHTLGIAALARGWNFVTYEGPGQPTVRRQQGLGFRPDWWTVVTPVIDFLLARPDVDPAALALVGESFGGILAPRAASREDRLAAVLCIDGLNSMQDVILAELPSQLNAIFTAGNQSVFDELMDEAWRSNETDTTFRWLIGQGLFTFATDSPYQWLTEMGAFNVEDVQANITVPVFVGSGQDDQSTKGQAEIVRDMLGDRAYYHLFKEDVGAGEHCQIGAEGQLAQVAYDWLEGVFAGARTGNGTHIG